MDIISMLLSSLQSIAILLVVAGLLMAFLWKIAFYVQLGLGLVVTLIVTFFVYEFAQRLGLPIYWVLFVFVIGVVATLIEAVMAAVMAIVNGFFLTWLGTFLLMVSGQVLDLGTLIGQLWNILLGSAILSVVLVGVSASAGSYLLRMPGLRRPLRKRVRQPERQIETEPVHTKNPQQTQMMERQKEFESPTSKVEKETKIGFLDHPTSNSCGICKEEWLIDSEVYKCAGCGTNFHLDCIREYLAKFEVCPKCQKKATLFFSD